MVGIMSRGFTFAAPASSRPSGPTSARPLVRSRDRVFGPSERDRAEWALAIAVRDVAALDRHHAACRTELGKANACRPWQRTAAKASAMRLINRARVQRRAAARALAAAQAAVAGCAPVALAA